MTERSQDGIELEVVQVDSYSVYKANDIDFASA